MYTIRYYIVLNHFVNAPTLSVSTEIWHTHFSLLFIVVMTCNNYLVKHPVGSIVLESSNDRNNAIMTCVHRSYYIEVTT